MERTDRQQAYRDTLSGLHCLTLPTPYSVGDVNVYLLEPAGSESPLTLLDTGPHWEPSLEALRHGLNALGYRSADLEQILISHPHPDHYGATAALVQESGAIVRAHPSSMPMLTRSSGDSPEAESFFREWFTRNGVPADVQAIIAGAQTEIHHDARPVRQVIALDEGAELSLAGQTWQVLATPGHSGGMLCFYQADDRILLASDHLIARISSNPVIEPPRPGMSERPRRLLQYIHSLERIAALNPAIAYSGHGPAIDDVAALVSKRIAFHQKRANLLVDKLAVRPATLFELTRMIFASDLPAVHLFLALSEVQGHLDLLENQGRAAADMIDGRLVWHTFAL